MITKMKQILGAAAAMLMLAACGSPKTNLPLEGTQWKLTEMDGKADPAFAAGEDTFNFTLDPSRMMVYGVGACNRLFGPYELEEGNGLDIERLASTMMACIIFSLFAASPPAIDPNAAAVTQVWSYIGELVFNMLVLVGAVKMADRVVREMMGL